LLLALFIPLSSLSPSLAHAFLGSFSFDYRVSPDGLYRNGTNNANLYLSDRKIRGQTLGTMSTRRRYSNKGLVQQKVIGGYTSGVIYGLRYKRCIQVRGEQGVQRTLGVSALSAICAGAIPGWPVNYGRNRLECVRRKLAKVSEVGSPFVCGMGIMMGERMM